MDSRCASAYAAQDEAHVLLKGEDTRETKAQFLGRRDCPHESWNLDRKTSEGNYDKRRPVR